MSYAIDLSGKTAIVTGGGRGIGKAIARSLAEAGANVVIASRKMEVLEATAKEFESLPGRVEPIACHVGRPDQIDALVAETEKRFGAVDILINNSATNIGLGSALQATDEAFQKMFEINVLAAHRLIRRVVPGMIERKRGGSIVNVASIAGLRPQPQSLIYSFTKAGLIMMTRSYAQEFGRHNIRVNAIAPGLIQTDFSSFFWKNDSMKEAIVGGQPVARIGQPEEIGPIALMLASDATAYMTGETIVVDGGATAKF